MRAGTCSRSREKLTLPGDALMTIHKDGLDTAPLGWLATARFAELDRAIARALDIRRDHLPHA